MSNRQCRQTDPEQPRRERASDKGALVLSPGDWSCSMCDNVNWARRDKCNRCGESKEQNRRGGSKRDRDHGDERRHKHHDHDDRHDRHDRERDSGGLFKAGDWACSMCGNINWQRRNTCNVCGIEKPGQTNEGPRDGLGGGFCERDESDDKERKRRREEEKEEALHRKKEKKRCDLCKRFSCIC